MQAARITAPRQSKRKSRILTAPVNFSELAKQIVAGAIRFASEFAILPPDDNGAGLCFSKILPANIRINVADPLTRADKIRLEISHVGEEKLRTKTILHGFHLKLSYGR